MKIVLDTNVLVSGLISPHGPPGEIVRMVSAGQITICHDARILSEYRRVLLRPKFPFFPEETDDLLTQIQVCGDLVASRPLVHKLPHPDDEPFAEIAVAAQAPCLVTGNVKHYPAKLLSQVKILSPAQFLEVLRNP